MVRRRTPPHPAAWRRRFFPLPSGEGRGGAFLKFLKAIPSKKNTLHHCNLDNLVNLVNHGQKFPYICILKYFSNHLNT